MAWKVPPWLAWNSIFPLVRAQFQNPTSCSLKKSPAYFYASVLTICLEQALTLFLSLAVESHWLFSGFIKGTHSPPWSNVTTVCTELSTQWEQGGKTNNQPLSQVVSKNVPKNIAAFRLVPSASTLVMNTPLSDVTLVKSLSPPVAV